MTRLAQRNRQAIKNVNQRAPRTSPFAMEGIPTQNLVKLTKAMKKTSGKTNGEVQDLLKEIAKTQREWYKTPMKVSNKRYILSYIKTPSIPRSGMRTQYEKQLRLMLRARRLNNSNKMVINHFKLPNNVSKIIKSKLKPPPKK